jgi:hypothetical protein
VVKAPSGTGTAAAAAEDSIVQKLAAELLRQSGSDSSSAASLFAMALQQQQAAPSDADAGGAGAGRRGNGGGRGDGDQHAGGSTALTAAASTTSREPPVEPQEAAPAPKNEVVVEFRADELAREIAKLEGLRTAGVCLCARALVCVRALAVAVLSTQHYPA